MRRLPTVLVALAFAASCGGSDSPDGAPAPGGNAAGALGVWAFESGHGPAGDIEPVPGHDITLELAGSKISGSGGCNSYGGGLSIDGTDFEAGGLAVSEIACEPDVTEAEERYLDAIGAADTIAVDGKTLTLTGPDTELVFSLVPPIDTAPLTGTTWILESLVEGETVSSTVAGARPARLLLSEDQTLEGTTGCRSFSGGWSTSGDLVTVTQLVFRGTCDRAVAQDTHVTAVIGTGFRAEVEGGKLHLTSDKDDFGLVYRRR